MALQIPNDAIDVEAIEAGDSDATAQGMRTILNALNGLLTRPTETGKWTPYTPVWSSTSGGTGSIGNGKFDGRYSIVGNVLFFNIYLEWGSTTTAPHASAQWTWTLPTGVIPDAFTSQGVADDVGVERVIFVAQRDSSQANLLLLRVSTNPVTATSPFTPNSGDTYRLSGVLEIQT